MTADQFIHAPFTAEQVVALNDYQTTRWFHPFTCGHCRDLMVGGVPFRECLLVATEAGWTCPTCDYTQDWAWKFMAAPLVDLPWSTP